MGKRKKKQKYATRICVQTVKEGAMIINKEEGQQKRKPEPKSLSDPD